MFNDVIDGSGFRVLATERRRPGAPELPDVHGDPFDRVLVAQALVEEMSVVTGNAAIAGYPVDVVW